MPRRGVVASGDYKVEPDQTCAPFEPVWCDTFITESTFGLPIYRWEPEQAVFDDIKQWWRKNAEAGRAARAGWAAASCCPTMPTGPG